jgi:hypothetical protein
MLTGIPVIDIPFIKATYGVQKIFEQLRKIYSFQLSILRQYCITPETLLIKTFIKLYL